MHFCLFPAPQSDLIIALQGCKVSILHDTTNKMLLICSPLLSFPVSQKLSAELMGRNPEHHSLLLTKCAGFESVLAQDLRVEKGYQVHPLYLGVHAYHDKLPNPTREEAVRKETITPHLVSVPQLWQSLRKSFLKLGRLSSSTLTPVSEMIVLPTKCLFDCSIPPPPINFIHFFVLF